MSSERVKLRPTSFKSKPKAPIRRGVASDFISSGNHLVTRPRKQLSSVKSKPEKPIPKVLVSGDVELTYRILHVFSEKIKQEEHSELSSYIVYPVVMLGARSPLRYMLEFQIQGAMAFIFVFKMPLTDYCSLLFQASKSEFNFIMNSTKKSDNIVLILHDYENEDEYGQVGKTDPVYEEWVEKVTEKNRVGRFDVSTKSGRGVNEAYQWLKEQLLLNVKRKEDTSHSAKKLYGSHWFGNLSKAALSFGS